MPYQVTTPKNNVLVNLGLFAAGIGSFVHLYKTTIPYEPGTNRKFINFWLHAAAATLATVSSGWYLASGKSITNSGYGVALLTASTTLPAAVAWGAARENVRTYAADSQEDALIGINILADTAAVTSAFSLWRTRAVETSRAGMAAFAASVTFPAAMTLLYYKAKDESRKEILQTAAISSAAVAGAVGLIALAARPTP